MNISATLTEGRHDQLLVLLDTSAMSPAATHLAFLRKVATNAPISAYRETYARQARELAGLIIQAGCRPVLEG
ncbi:hypothetical protein [Rhodoferax sp.]|uniref:hypothetical protein n=1 Tax=Rhodoferax sp. TaxID=50421 RepID=UPI0028513BF0|nr:hypothetical protein [Rhodoferax sp.]MDR3370694.1 hypothetical protein [Rhodoferax sp.]